MDKPIERELKILVREDEFQTLLKTYAFSKPWIQTNTYYDSPDQIIKKQGGALRIRTIGTKHILTLKIRKDEITHYELEKEIDTEDVSKIKDSEITGWFQEFHIPKDLNQIAQFTTTRQVYECENAQLCADKTVYPNHTDYEIEYEYHRNHDGISEFNQILSIIGVKYKKNCPSKIARAFKICE